MQVTPLYTIWRSTRETIRRWVTKGSWCWVRKLRFGEIHNPLTYVFICVFKYRLFLKCISNIYIYIHMYYFHTYIYWCLNVYMHIDLIAQISPRSFPLTTLCYLAFYCEDMQQMSQIPTGGESGRFVDGTTYRFLGTFPTPLLGSCALFEYTWMIICLCIYLRMYWYIQSLQLSLSSINPKLRCHREMYDCTSRRNIWYVHIHMWYPPPNTRKTPIHCLSFCTVNSTTHHCTYFCVYHSKVIASAKLLLEYRANVFLCPK